MKIEVSRLTVREPFKSLFPIEPDVVKALTADMKANGFDAAQSVFAWKAPGGELVLVDGHMRLQAAKAARLQEVHVTVRKFADEDEAFGFAIKMQRDRRNLSQKDIAAAIAKNEIGAKRNLSHAETNSPRGRGRPADVVAQTVVAKAAKQGVSRATAHRELAKVRAENGTSRTPRTTASLQPRVSKSEEALATYRVVASLNRGELAPHMHSTLRAMVKLAEGLDRTQAETAVSAVWGVLDGAYRDKRRPTDLVKIATSKETQ